VTGGVYTSAGGDERTANTPDNPWPVRTVNTKIADWVHKLGQIWVEGQITQISRRPRSRVAFITLRDPAADMSVQVTCNPDLIDRAPVPLTEGSRVVMLGRPTFYTGRATLSLRVSDIRPVGIGELLARIERLRQLLAAEGLFDPRLKQPLPFLPKAVGLISGRASAAQRDVVAVATARWPSVRFEIRDATVQGPAAVPSILPLLADLDAAEHVEVIVIARGGGSVEDLLAFSNEALVRAVAGARTPVVSAIGHDIDTPILDLVADVRASTPTHAAGLVVPDAAEMRAQLDLTTLRLRRAIGDRLQRERRRLVELTSRPVLTDRTAYVRSQRIEIATMRRRGQLRIEAAITREQDRVEHLRRQARMLSPQATLDRGYALVTTPDGEVVTDQDQVDLDDLLRVRVARGDFAVRATAS